MGTTIERSKILNIMSKMYGLLTDPSKSPEDVLIFIKQNVQEDGRLKNVFPEITDAMLEEVRNNYKTNEMNEDEFIEYSGDHHAFKVSDNIKLDKKFKSSFVNVPTKEEGRYLTDSYYQTQKKRIAIENQLRSVEQGNDESVNLSFSKWYLENTYNMEKEIAKALKVFCDNCYLAKWACSVTGIGPTIAARLVSLLEIARNEDGSTDMHAGNWWAYCGLNDNKRPWLGREKSDKIINDVIKECDGIIDDETVMKISEKTKWSFSYYESKAKDESGCWSKAKLISSSAIIPYNKELKLLMYKIGHSFLMCKNKEQSLYGKLLKKREELENMKNLRGDYAEQAAEILRTKKFDKSTVAYKYYSEGKLPPAHISQRCQRYVTKLFISHLFEAEYYNIYGTLPKQPYILCFSDTYTHADYIGPEVPYDTFKRDYE